MWSFGGIETQQQQIASQMRLAEAISSEGENLGVLENHL